MISIGSFCAEFRGPRFDATFREGLIYRFWEALEKPINLLNSIVLPEQSLIDGIGLVELGSVVPLMIIIASLLKIDLIYRYPIIKRDVF